MSNGSKKHEHRLERRKQTNDRKLTMCINVYIKGKILLVNTRKQPFLRKYRYVPRVFTQMTNVLHINRCFTSQLSKHGDALQSDRLCLSIRGMVFQ